MPKNQPMIPIAKCGKYKQSIMDVQKWQVHARKQNSTLFQWFQWVLGN